ncbi:MAG TPA: hypothetical protein PKE63_08165 [Lacibacter sp.]|nr:hypothetical protein [Lacibacter sp.]HMO89742.1 hypothetical protein [Lacibacter sp.]HMP87240.1 hypothetical protein [Lacibacter sp.]
MKQLILIAAALCASQLLAAQEKRPGQRDAKRQERQNKISNLIRQQEEGALVFNKQNVYGLRVNTDGWNLFYERGTLKNVKVTNLLSFELGEKKHPKEKKLSYDVVTGNFIQLGTPYIYGKENIFYQFKPGFGQQRLIGGKTNKNGVAVHWIYMGGISLGLERPYYVRIFDAGLNGTRDIKYSVADSAAFLTPGNIIQGTGLRYGWGEMKLVPGAHARTAIRFDYGRFNDLVSAIEIGVNVEAYSRKANIMLLNNNNQVFFNSYIAILFGKRK